MSIDPLDVSTWLTALKPSENVKFSGMHCVHYIITTFLSCPVICAQEVNKRGRPALLAKFLDVPSSLKVISHTERYFE